MLASLVGTRARGKNEEQADLCLGHAIHGRNESRLHRILLILQTLHLQVHAHTAAVQKFLP